MKPIKKIQFHIITALPGIIDSYFVGGMMKKAIDKKLISVKEHNLHDFSNNRYGSVDDTPYGGGAGMVLQVEPIYKALEKIRNSKSEIRKNKTEIRNSKSGIRNSRTVLFSAAGKRMTQRDVERLANYDQIIFVCGRYEGVDERVLEFVDEELSIGDYVLTGGELPALVVIDAVSRLIPGVLGNVESAKEESHAINGILEFPQYTKPESFKFEIRNSKSEGRSKSKVKKFKTLSVPEVLRGGNHKLIKEWREENRKRTKN